MDINAIRGDFPALRDWAYLDNAFVGLMPNQVREGYDEWADQWLRFDPAGSGTILSSWLEKTRKVRGMVADFIGVGAHEIAFTMCTGSGLNIVINGLTWEKGDNAVFPEWEHNPLDTHMMRRRDVEPRVIHARDGRFELADLEGIVDDRTRLVQISQVSYVNGFRFDLKEVADIAHDHGAKVLVDATQAVGALRVNYKRDDVDFVAVAPYKYLMGPAGLAFLYVKEENIPELAPDRVGWKNQIWEGDRAEEPTNPETAEKFEYGTIHFQGVYALERSLSYLSAIGMDVVESRIVNLTGYLYEQLQEMNKPMLTPGGNKSPIVSYRQDGAVELASRLMSKKIKVTGREAHGGHMRISAHFYNNQSDIDRLAQEIGA